MGHVSTSNCGADDLHVHLRRLVGVKGRILCKSEKHARLAFAVSCNGTATCLEIAFNVC